MKKIMAIFVLIQAIILSGCDLKSGEDYRIEASKLEQKQDYKGAIILLNKSIEKDPKNINALFERGFDKNFLNDFKGSIDDCSKVLELDPNNTLALLNRGKNKRNLEKFNEAIIDFNAAIATKGGEELYMDRVENSFVNTGFEYDAKMEEIRYERGIAYYFIDSLRKAFKDFKSCIGDNYSWPGSYYWRGLIYSRYNMKEEACHDFNKGAELGDEKAKKWVDKYCK